MKKKYWKNDSTEAKSYTSRVSNSTREVLSRRLRHAKPRTAPAAFFPRRALHLIFLFSLILKANVRRLYWKFLPLMKMWMLNAIVNNFCTFCPNGLQKDVLSPDTIIFWKNECESTRGKESLYKLYNSQYLPGSESTVSLTVLLRF